ncbi:MULTISPECIES: DegV family protein [Bacillus]|uniref:DegV family protein n=1 Tax=Bacillus glycinifermentans TaxID=1664069 RepID=A0AAJ3YWW2_9BACI|nr:MULTISPECIES: DegV family protein [Bacillus]KKB73383.1 DegV domain-containing protein YitS [Bacillus sp. TH008]MBU8787390.1 DegV family protein [Bacillus glycinifermentans]MDU0069591.1 DegV family protein [Bacillus sp. IG6]MED8017430.1 DegV family protein [Bacillus glycinifermentans]NUJ17021.1 DegV family protein [Bacillus glycinifermentans]
MTVHLIADSAADLPKSFYDDNGVTFIPLRVLLDDKEYDDLVTIQPLVVYEAMRNGKAPKTSQPSFQLMKDAFTNLAKKNQPALYIAFSSELSGTYQTAVMAANEVKEEFPDFDLRIIDSKCASLGYGLAVKHALELATNGNTIQEIETSVKDFCDHLEHIFTVDDLTYLARGGRISKASAFVGGLLNIKPLLDVEGGKLVPLEKIRGKKKLLKRMIELMKERGRDLSSQTIGISHGDAEETAGEIKRLIEAEFHPKDIVVHMIGSAIGAHAGPGTVAVFFSGKEKR